MKTTLLIAALYVLTLALAVVAIVTLHPAMITLFIMNGISTVLTVVQTDFKTMRYANIETL